MSRHRSSRAPLVLLGACALAGVAALSAPPNAAMAASKRCPTSGSTVAQNQLVRVYTKPNAGEIDPVYACEFKAGKPFKLDAIKGRECQNARRIGQTVLAGTMIAFQVTECELETAFDHLSVWNAKKRKRIVNVANVADIPDAPAGVTADGFTELESLVLRTTGAVAWIGRGGYDHKSTTDLLEVHGIPARGKDAVLDSGADVVGDSLALARKGTLYWTKGSVVRSGRL